jgi:diguanylate cyclase (GGDEF)-like protein
MITFLDDLVPLSSSMNVLFIDDDAQFREETVSFLVDIFARVDIACNGEEALNLYTQNHYMYDIVITDLSMPIMDGITLIKQVQLLNPSQSILVISAYNEAYHLLECIHLGVTGYVLKPIHLKELISSLYKIALYTQNDMKQKRYKEELELSLEERKVELEKNYHALQNALTTDTVTGLPNSVMLHRTLDQLKQSDEVTLVLCNINYFSLINHSYGFEFGDQVLKKLGEFLISTLALFKPDIQVFRYVSDEFAIVIHQDLDHQEMIQQLQVLLKETPIITYDDEPIYLTISSGIASSKKPSILLVLAQEALKEARHRGIPNQICSYDEQKVCLQKSDVKFTWIKKLRLALEEGRVVPYFHPIVDNITQEIFSYECLARIKEDYDKIISPALFIPAARQSGLMTNLTKNIIAKSFQIFSKTDTRFSINISYEDLLCSDFVEYICYKQKQYAIKSHNVTLEILEDVAANEKNKGIFVSLEILKEMGYQIALDDFGSDRSNFNRFENIGVDFLKIDGQFIRGIDQHLLHQGIVESIVHMAHNLKIKVVAEFVETKAEYEMLKALGVHYSQGYYFYQPSAMPVCYRK